MRRNTFPPRPKADDARMRPPELPKRKVFNCIVDDTALVAGVKKSTRDGIRKWVSQGAIRLFVPLHTLAQINRMKVHADRTSADAREAVKWLDDITSMPAIETSGRVQIEGVDEAYETWEEVEKFLLPETLLSMEESDSSEEDEDEYPDDLESSFHALDISDGTSMSSAQSVENSPAAPHPTEPVFSAKDRLPEHDAGNGTRKQEPVPLAKNSPNRTARNSAELTRTDKPPSSVVPPHLQPLFSHILWRINTETNPGAALENYILLTNDPNKQAIAQKFGIRAKRLEQLRDAVAREDREYKNHLTMYKMESEGHKTKDDSCFEAKTADRPKSSYTPVSKPASDSDEDEVLLKRAPRGPAQPTSNARLWDPNEFGRANQHHSLRGARGGFGPSRGRGGPPRGSRGGFAPRGAYVPPAPPFRAPPAPRHDPNQPIDPDSFARPALRGGPMRGNKRKLWEPN